MDELLTTKQIERFWSLVDRRDEFDCWPWTGRRDDAGYGTYSARPFTDSAHRTAWMIENATRIPEGRLIRHTCDNPPCCNPAHLRLGQALDNARDRSKRRRSGPGAVRERSPGRWELRVFLGTDVLNGRQRVATKTVAATSERSARRELARFLEEVEYRRPGADPRSFGELIDGWLDLKASTWSPTTLKEHRRIAATHLEPLHKIRVDNLRTQDLDRFYVTLSRQGGPGGRPLDSATVRRIHVVVRAALQQAVRWEWIDRNPAANVTSWSADEAEATPPTIEELGRLLEEAERDAPELCVFVIVAAVTGARRGALCALRWSDLDLEAGVVRFPRVIVDGPDGVVERVASKSKRSAKVAALDPVTTAALAHHRLRMEARAIELGTMLVSDGFVFTDDPVGAVPWRPDSTSRRYRRARDRAGLPSTIRLHDLRHFMATLALAGGIDPKTVATRGGWRQAATLLDRYAHRLEPADRKAAELLGDAVHGGRHLRAVDEAG